MLARVRFAALLAAVAGCAGPYEINPFGTGPDTRLPLSLTVPPVGSAGGRPDAPSPQPLSLAGLVLPPAVGARASAGAVVRAGSGFAVAVARVAGAVGEPAGGETLLLLPAVLAGGEGAVTLLPAGGTAVTGRVERRNEAGGLLLVRAPLAFPLFSVRPKPPTVSEPVRPLPPHSGDGPAGLVAGEGLADLGGAAVEPGTALVDVTGRLIGVALPVPPIAGPARQGLLPFAPAAAALRALGLLRPDDGLDPVAVPPT